MGTAKRALHGTFFVAINSYASILVAFVTGIALARILDPADFGLYRISLFFLDLFGRSKEFGLDKALIHKQGNLEKSFRTHFTLQLLFSLLTLVLVLIFSPFLGRFYRSEVSYFIVILAFFSLFQALSTTQKVSLEKNLNFSTTAAIDVTSLVLSSTISVVLAFRGLGPLSLVLGYGLNFFFNFTLLWIIRPWKVPMSDLILWDVQEIKWILKFGSFLFLGGLTTFILYKYNDFILGTFLSAAALGYYSRAFNYAQIPTSLITSVISKVALPTYSALQNEKEKLAGTFEIVLKSIVRVSFPLSLVLYMVADDFTVFVLGPKWIPMIPIFRILLIYGVFRSIFDDLGELFTAVGKPKIVSIYLFFQAFILLFLAPYLTGLYKAEGAAISLSLVLALGVILGYFFLRKILKIRVASVLLPTITVCFLTMICFKYVVFKFSLNFPDPFLSLVTKLGVFATFYLIIMALIDGKSFVKDVKFMLAHLK